MTLDSFKTFIEEKGKDFKLNSPSDNQLNYALKLLNG